MANEIYARIAAVLADADAIGKDRTNTQQGFKFRGIDDVYNALHPILAKHQVFSTTEVLEDRTEERTTKSGAALIYRILKVRFTFYTIDGSSVSEIVIGEGMDSGDKASNKAMAIAHKYALLQLLAIPTEDQKDPDAESHEVAPKMQPGYVSPDYKKEALEMIEKLGVEKNLVSGMLAAHGGIKDEQTGKWAHIDWKSLHEELIKRRLEIMPKEAIADEEAPF